MGFSKKIKEKILNLSNSYNFYKNQYYSLLNQKEVSDHQIEFLTKELSKNQFHLNQITESISKNNNVLSDYKEFFQKIIYQRDAEIKSINNQLTDILNNEKNFKTNLDKFQQAAYDKILIKTSELINSNYVEFYSKYAEDMGKIRNLIESENNSIKNQIDIVNDKLKNNNDLNSNLSKLVTAYKNYYKDSRKYFFNGYESVLSEVMDVDFLFSICYFNNIEFVSYSPEENRLLLKTEDGIIFSTNNHLWTFMEIFGLNEYKIPQLFSFDDFVVFDIGMNRAYASLMFANFDNCSKVYGFEIDKFTYQRAVDNIKLNPKLGEKINTYNFGLSDENDVVELYYIEGYDGLNTMIFDFTEIQPSLISFKEKINVTEVDVKIASEVISEIIESDQITSKKVLKIDTEGAEYKIINDLINSGLINQIDVILGEAHNFSDENFNEDLLNIGFVPIKITDESFTYSFAYVKKDYYKFWPNTPLK